MTDVSDKRAIIAVERIESSILLIRNRINKKQNWGEELMRVIEGGGGQADSAMTHCSSHRGRVDGPCRSWRRMRRTPSVTAGRRLVR